MARAVVGLCTIEFHLPGVASLKEKRRILKPMLAKLHNTFNVSGAEVDYHDKWQSALIAFVTVSNSALQADNVIRRAVQWIEIHFPDAIIVNQEVEIL